MAIGTQHEENRSRNCNQLAHPHLLCRLPPACVTSRTTTSSRLAAWPCTRSRRSLRNAVNSKDHTTLVAAVKAAGLVDVLSEQGAVHRFRAGQQRVSTALSGRNRRYPSLSPENKDMLTKILTYHVVAGRIDSKELRKRIGMGHGKAMLKTVEGESLWAEMNGPSNIIITDAKGEKADISTYDVYQSNGVIHVIDKVLMP